MAELPVQRGKTYDKEAGMTYVFQGWHLAQLAKLFGRDAGDIRDALLKNSIEPHAIRRGHPVYLVKDIAHLIIAPHNMIKADDQERILRNMNPKWMSKELHREFWAGQRAKQIYEENDGDLWRTEDVFEHISEAFATLRTDLLVARDTVDQETEITEHQRQVVGRIFDSTLINLQKSLIEKFQERQEKNKSNAKSETVESYDL